jgi:hypothetical protein
MKRESFSIAGIGIPAGEHHGYDNLQMSALPSRI